MAGTLGLVRLIGRNERVRILVWVLAIPAAVLATASSVKGLYPTQAESARLRRPSGATPRRSP